MKINAEKNGVQWSQRSDPRITKVGKFLRATRIDELPQLFCVIQGSMSLIGPRPERPEIEMIYLKPSHIMSVEILLGQELVVGLKLITLMEQVYQIQ